ncbi:MAG TPA: di-heme-cytochrome C peroxidase [Candidatus Solibacter sp.]|nr:di-heme-cytochrome C peroxidase [Candidatus Solibacter sp.]
MKRIAVVTFLIVLLLAGGAYTYLSQPQFRVDVPKYQSPPAQLINAEQGWTDDQRLHFHHTSQGTRLIPYDWFMALEQPCLSLFACDLFSDKTYLARFGFLSSQANPKLNPDGLPVGFARQENLYDPETKTTYAVVGLTCAACHTGELHYGNYAVQIDGGPALIEVTQFQKALLLAVGFTQKLPFRYGRFEKRLLGPNASGDQKADLKRRFTAFIDSAKFELDHAGPGKGIYDNLAGFGRTDALTRIGNQVFAVDMLKAENFAPANAPVRFPQIWDASWFNWVQYDSSIADPILRNIGESLGVRASAKLYGGHARDFDNSVHMEGLKELEWLLSGAAPYQGLRAPNWPSVFPALDDKKVARGAELYKSMCQPCHLPPVEDLVADLKKPQPMYWWENRQKKRFMIVKDIKQSFVGTDPHEAMDFINRTADSGDLGKGRISAAVGLEVVTNGIANKYFDKMKLTPEQQIEWRAGRDPRDSPIRAEAIYKARPLNGIWAVSPYLHNGSVPSLYALLSPQSERPDKFWTGSKEFDPVKVGHDTSDLNGGYLYDVSKPGNDNHGHEFKDGPRGNGVIGPALSSDDRYAIIEYLKSLVSPSL